MTHQIETIRSHEEENQVSPTPEARGALGDLERKVLRDGVENADPSIEAVSETVHQSVDRVLQGEASVESAVVGEQQEKVSAERSVIAAEQPPQRVKPRFGLDSLTKLRGDHQYTTRLFGEVTRTLGPSSVHSAMALVNL